MGLFFPSNEMNKINPPSPPPASLEEDKGNDLPKTCYFNDGKTKVDYVIVFPKIEDRVRGDRTQPLIDQFVTQIKEKGLLVEKDAGKFYTTLVFLKIHGSQKVLLRYANIYNISVTCQNPYYKYKETIWLDCLTTEITKPHSSSDVYKRAEKTLSGERPNQLTTTERSRIVYEVLKRINFMYDDEEVTLKAMLDREVFLQAYAIHDGDCYWTTEGPLTDRQLLYAYWVNVKYMFREQPIHLIEKYYGPKLGFYFALVSFYTKMLIVPTVIGVISIIAGFIFLHLEGVYIEEEVCNSNITLCSDQRLQSACNLMKLAYVIDNPVTIVYVIICSFWGAVFWNLWQRRQAMLRLRWNLIGMKADRTMRPEFQENAFTRRSSITGEIEYYVPPIKNVLSYIFSYAVIGVMVLIYFLIIFLIIEYRFFLRKRLNYDETRLANEIELFSSSIITTLLIMILDRFGPYILRFYAKLIRFLTLLRMPRTQTQYNRMFLHMMFILTFANHFSPLLYLAFIKGFLYTYPGSESKFQFLSRVDSDLCKPSGCLVDLGMLLISVMIIKTLVNCSFDLVRYLASPWFRHAIPRNTEKQYGQWEKDYAMKELDQSSINELYTQMVMQYSFITFFNASLPIIGLIALVHNLLKIQHDAYRFLKLYRRPILEKAADIEGWNHIIKIVTIFGTISNAFIVAFRTDFILRNMYRNSHNGSLKGYVNSTLSKFAISDFEDEDMIIDHESETYCFYRGFRYPPEHENQYDHTPEYWRHFATTAVYFIILENITLISSLVLGYIIPEIPRKVKVKLEYDEKMLKAVRETQMETQM